MRLSFPIFVALVLAAFVGLDVWTRLSYRTRDGLHDKVVTFAESAPAGRNLVILGTCLPEQHIRADILQQKLGVSVHNLGVQATSPLDWYLAFKNGLPHDRVDGLVVAYGVADLEAEITPYESRVMELAGPGDLPDLLDEVCATPECRVDVALRWAWPTYRYRARIANRVWRALGALPYAQALAPPPRSYKGAGARYVRRLLHEARAADIPVFMVPLPRRPDPARPAPPAYIAEEERMFTEEGAVLVRSPELSAYYFESDVHLSPEGAATLSYSLADTLATKL